MTTGALCLSQQTADDAKPANGLEREGAKVQKGQPQM